MIGFDLDELIVNGLNALGPSLTPQSLPWDTAHQRVT